MDASIIIDPWAMSRRDVKRVFYYFARYMETATEPVQLMIELPEHSVMEVQFDGRFVIRMPGVMGVWLDLRKHWVRYHELPLAFDKTCEKGEAGRSGKFRRRRRFNVMPLPAGRFSVEEKFDRYELMRRLRVAPQQIKWRCVYAWLRILKFLEFIERKINETF